MTVLGHHSVAELSDWLKALDYQVAQIGAANAGFEHAWQVQDPAAAKEWERDWKAFQSRYNAAHLRAQIAIGRAQLDIAVPDSLIPVEDEWQAVLHALSKTPGMVAKGDLQDLYNRIVAAQGKPVDMSQIPQPKAADPDLMALKVADATIRAGESAARSVVQTARGAEMSPGTKFLVGGGILLGLLLATKAVLR